MGAWIVAVCAVMSSELCNREPELYVLMGLVGCMDCRLIVMDKI